MGFDEGTYLSLFFEFALSVRLSDNLRGSVVLIFSELINIASILYYIYVEFIMLLYIFLVISFSKNKEYMI